MKFSNIYLFLLITNLLIINVDCESYPYSNDDIINFCLAQDFNITDPKDEFFNDRCSIFYSDTKRDVSLEYRRKYYYYPNNDKAILDETTIKTIFPEIKRNSILSCFKHYFNIKTMVYNLTVYFILIIFSMQITSFILLLTKGYKTASQNNPEAYINYMNYKKFGLDKIKESNSNGKNINNGFNPLNEETKISNKSKDENFPTDESFENGQVNNKNQIEFNDSIKTKNKLDILKDSSITNELKKNIENIQKNKSFNKDEIYTFGAIKIKLDDDNNVKKSININNEINGNNKDDNAKYIYNRINYKPNKINNKMKENEQDALPDELFYFGFPPAFFEDKRTLKQIYFDILPHCQIVFLLFQKYFIYEDTRITMIYYTIKLELYIFFNNLLLNDVSIINKIYDKKFHFNDYLKNSLIAVVLVNVISQLLFRLTNSKGRFIKHINKMKKSIHKNSTLLKFSINEIISIINSYLLIKLISLCFLIFLFFIIGFYFCLCFCSTYYYSQFIALINIFICIIISQIFPFILALIPAYLRKKSLEKKSEKLYNFSKLINLLFIP